MTSKFLSTQTLERHAPLAVHLEEKADESTKTSVFSIGQLSTLIKGCVEDTFSFVSVQGEVSMPKLHASGHLYFALKDQAATLDAVCWRGVAGRFVSLVTHGKQVICKGKVTTYAGRSKYQLIVQEVVEAGEGDLHLLLEARKKKLRAEGLFEDSRKKSLPRFPRIIGLITSPTGAVIQDMLHRIKARFPCPVTFYPTNVQGERAANDLVEALSIMAHKAAPPDVIILARGGGSFEDLWPFNDEDLVRTVAACPIPLVTAVGHETDTTLVDYAADRRAPTPSAAAEMITPDRLHVSATLRTYRQRVGQGARATLQTARLQHATMIQKLAEAGAVLRCIEQTLDDCEARLMHAATVIERARHKMEVLAKRLRSPETHLKAETLRLKHLMPRLTHALHGFWRTWKQRQVHGVAQLEAFSHKRVLARGYCLVKEDASGAVVTSALHATAHRALNIVFHDGDLRVVPDAKSTSDA